MTSKRKAVVPVEDLTEKQAKAEHARLTDEIAGHDRRYYQEDAPTVTDAEYDEMRRRYAAIEARFPQLATRDSLSQRVGAAPSPKRMWWILSAASAASCACPKATRSCFRPSRRSTACRCRFATRAAS